MSSIIQALQKRPLHTRREIAEIFRVSERTVDVWRQRKILTSIKIGGGVRFDTNTVIEKIGQLTGGSPNDAA
jgi:phage terminase Nu1 subunit (DNA packaging protein)